MEESGIGAAVGAFGLSVGTFLYHWLLFRGALSDGQYSMVFMFTVPAGGILGLATGYILTELQAKPIAKGATCLLGVCVVALPLGLYLLMTTTNSSNTGKKPITALIEGLLFAAPTLVWMSGLLLRGLLFLIRKA